jgi:transposase InsO family protein
MRFEQKQLGAHVKVLMTDGGGEYGGPLLRQFLFEDNGTFHRVSAPYKSDDNGGVERLIGILEAMTRVMMASCTLPTPYFVYAWVYAVLLHNVLRCATR